ncbi:MAG: hypothetical protein JNJ47_01950, partial [Alphaproteobacteria bacterium]|nr:hypothetical protein [Alphaproteobacteria bacterium]
MIKNIIKTMSFAVIFTLYLPLTSFAMGDEFELDVGKTTLKTMRDIPEENFHKARIKLINITSDTKFFDNNFDEKTNNNHYKYSIAYKLLKAILGGHVERIEYSYSEEKKSLYMTHEFMDCVAKGQKIAVTREKDGTKIFELRSNYEVYECSGALKYREFREFGRKIIVVNNGRLHFLTQKWQDEEEINERLRQLSLMEAEDRRRERAEERLETMGGGAYGLAKGYDPYVDDSD